MPAPNSTSFAAGPAHPRFRGGAVDNEHGYRRVTTGRRNQMPYEHRHVIEQLMLEQAIAEATRRVTTEGAGADPWDESPDQVAASIEFLIAREVMALVANPPRIAPGVQVHHIDYNKQHNCPQNLMLLDGPLHRAVTTAHRRYVRRHNEDQMMARLRGETA
jgi:hypothetical protein